MRREAATAGLTTTARSVHAARRKALHQKRKTIASSGFVVVVLRAFLEGIRLGRRDRAPGRQQDEPLDPLQNTGWRSSEGVLESELVEFGYLRPGRSSADLGA